MILRLVYLTLFNVLKITLFNKDKNLVLVFNEDSNDHLYKCHANNISAMVKKLYKQELLKVYIAKVQSTT